jgi:mannose/fructose/N-acetylgalactosamine-specific phosphotransferase system component IID
VPRFVPLGGIGDTLASGFVAAASETLAAGTDVTGG